MPHCTYSYTACMRGWMPSHAVQHTKSVANKYNIMDFPILKASFCEFDEKMASDRIVQLLRFLAMDLLLFEYSSCIII